MVMIKILNTYLKGGKKFMIFGPDLQCTGQWVWQYYPSWRTHHYNTEASTPLYNPHQEKVLALTLPCSPCNGSCSSWMLALSRGRVSAYCSCYLCQMTKARNKCQSLTSSAVASLLQHSSAFDNPQLYQCFQERHDLTKVKVPTVTRSTKETTAINKWQWEQHWRAHL